MRRRGTEIPSFEGVEMPGIGIVSSPPKKRPWFRLHSNELRITADVAASVGLVPVLAAVDVKTGLNPMMMAGVIIPAIGLVSDAVDRVYNGSAIPGTPLIIEPPKGTEISDGSRVSTPLHESRRSRVVQGIHDAVQMAGHPVLIVMTAELVNARNIPGAIGTAVAEVVLISNSRRQSKIINSFSENVERRD